MKSLTKGQWFIVAAILAIIVYYFFIKGKKEDAALGSNKQTSATNSDVAADPRTYLTGAAKTEFEGFLKTTKWIIGSGGDWFKSIDSKNADKENLWWYAWREVLYAQATEPNKNVLMAIPKQDVALAYNS